jgi:hypothetical protein
MFPFRSLKFSRIFPFPDLNSHIILLNPFVFLLAGRSFPRFSSSPARNSYKILVALSRKEYFSKFPGYHLGGGGGGGGGNSMKEKEREKILSGKCKLVFPPSNGFLQNQEEMVQKLSRNLIMFFTV